MHQDVTWYWYGVELGAGHIMLDGDQALLPKRGQSPQLLAHVYCGQTAGWIKITLGMEEDLGPGDIVLDGIYISAPFPQKRGSTPTPLFGPCLLWPSL